MKTPSLLREVVREYVRSQRRIAQCGDTASTVECHILTELLRVEPVTQQELADRLMLDKGWISRGVDRLAADGLVRRAPDPADRRRVQLRLASAGRACAEALDARLDGHARALLGSLAPDQDGELAVLLAHVLTNLREQRCALPPTAASEGVTFRPAAAADWPAIEALLRDAGLGVDDAAACLGHFIVGMDGAGLVAVGGVEPCGADALLRSFAVSARARSRAHGSTLLRHVLGAARDAGYANAYLLTQTAEGFFARHGFEPVARSAAPQSIRSTRQFTGLCPASASLMARSLSNLDDTPC
jgi:DNA-binding MarR family transcriptional regulator/N-acetylglutamate synthase-like GNAT family acetyltransferase